MKKRLLVLLLVLLAISMHSAFSHEDEEQFDLDHSDIYPISQLSAVGYGSLVFGVLIAIIIFFGKIMNNAVKKIVYFLVIVVASLVTLYLVLTTLHLNIISATKGPVHWHADYELLICGKEYMLPEPKGLTNKQGTDLMHSHDDNRIHVEGVLLDKKQVAKYNIGVGPKPIFTTSQPVSKMPVIKAF